MGMFDFLSDIPIVSDVIDFGQDLFGDDGMFGKGSSGGFDLGGTIKSIFDAVKPWSPEIVGAASAYGSLEGQKSANETNIALADKATAFNAAQAGLNRDFQDSQARRQMDFQADQTSKQMGFQERMAGSAYQRAAADMKAAGFNPMLALMKGGADSPAGASASGASGSGSSASSMLARVENAVAPAINSGNIASKVSQELRNLRVSNDNLEKQGKQIDAYTKVLEAQVPYLAQQTLTSNTSAINMGHQSALLRGQLERVNYEIDKLVAERRNIDSETGRRRFDLERLMPLQEKAMDIQAQLMGYEIPGARNRASAEGSAYSGSLRPYIKDIFGAAGAAGSIGLRRR